MACRVRILIFVLIQFKVQDLGVRSHVKPYFPQPGRVYRRGPMKATFMISFDGSLLLCALQSNLLDPYASFRKLGVPCFEVLIIRILLFRVLYQGPLFSETP